MKISAQICSIEFHGQFFSLVVIVVLVDLEVLVSHVVTLESAVCIR